MNEEETKAAEREEAGVERREAGVSGSAQAAVAGGEAGQRGSSGAGGAHGVAIAAGTAPPRDDEDAAPSAPAQRTDLGGLAWAQSLPREAVPRARRTSLAGRVTAAVGAALLLAAAGAALAVRYELTPRLVFLIVLALGLPFAAWMVARLLRPLDRVIGGVADGIRSFRDHDFSVRLAYQGDDELGQLVRLYNDVGRLLQEERHLLRQRELLLQTALDRSPAAILLVGPTGRVVYANREARQLLLGGAPLEGRGYDELRAGCPPAMQEVMASDTDGLFTVRDGERVETFHLSRRSFRLNYRRHELVLLRRLTGELGRQEADIWKKVLRVVSHELNNSLAPISSLVHSARIIASDPRHAHRADEVFATLRERLDHLQRFLDGYAKFARLPRPRPEAVDWTRFLETVQDFPQVHLVGAPPVAPGWFDPAQLRQVLVNLFKNAVEASEGNGAGQGAVAGAHSEADARALADARDPEVRLRIESAPQGGTWIQVTDHGRGMDEETMRQALLPFYSTKPGGSGLGLALCREILEAHGGKIALQSRPGEGTVVTCWLPPR
ncbi:MAG TPA: ATP-binding protein [Thermoanaerobaculia bacterium]|nr:ATP-binding protein [Thermoanaerobaculia bacterium]